MPLLVGASGTGIKAVGTGTLADLEKLIPNPDVSPAKSIGYNLDEMSPEAAIQLRIEINKYLSTNGDPAGTTAVVVSGVGLEVAVTGTYVDTITPTVAAGVITGFVLS